jgi:hypothetical protein
MMGGNLVYHDSVTGVRMSAPAPCSGELDRTTMEKAFAAGQIYRCTLSGVHVPVYMSRSADGQTLKYAWRMQGIDHMSCWSGVFMILPYAQVMHCFHEEEQRKQALAKQEKDEEDEDDDDEDDEAKKSETVSAAGAERALQHFLPLGVTRLHHLSPPSAFDKGIVPGMKIYGERVYDDDEYEEDDQVEKA